MREIVYCFIGPMKGWVLVRCYERDTCFVLTRRLEQNSAP
jgi:hypothetical protein